MSEQNKDAELLPCPFCGSNDLEVHGKPGILNAHDDVGCNGCNAFTPAPTWNRRSLPVGVPDGSRGFASIAKQCMDDEAATWAGDNKDAARLALDDAYMRILIALASPAAPTVKAEQVLPGCCGTPENCPIDYSRCPHLGQPPAPSLPAAGSAVEEVEVVAYLHERSGSVATADNVRVMEEGSVSSGYTIRLMTVTQHQRIVAAISAQQSAHVSVPECVRNWFDARLAHVEAVDAYNTRQAFIRKHMPFGASPDPEYQIMEAADRKVRELNQAMFFELRAILNGGEV